MPDKRPLNSQAARAVQRVASASAALGVVSSWFRNGRWLSALSVGLVFLGWYLVNALALVPEVLLPGPGEVLAAFIDIVRNGYRETTLWQNCAATLWRCGAGFVLACLSGVPLGLAMGYSAKVRAACNYIIQFMRPLPPLSYLILLILWLGTGDGSKIALLYLTAFPIVASSAMAGVWMTKLQRIQAARSLGASEWRVFRHVVFPSALPLIFTGARIALAAAFSTVVAAELMAATDGLGWMIFSASRFLRNDIIIIGILVLGVLGMTLSKLLLILDGAIVHWRSVD
jgi:taurine transport system permease protein